MAACRSERMFPDKKPERALYIPPHLRAGTSSPRLSHICNEKAKNNTNNNRSSVASATNDAESLQAILEALSLSGELRDRKGARVAAVKNNATSVTNGQSTTTTTTPSTPASVAVTPEPQLDYKKFGHILELYNFRKELNSADLQAELAGFEESGFYLKWVDDHHCLAVFSSPTEADRALAQISRLLVDARRFKEASLESKLKLAKSPGDWAMPYKKRPPTSSSTAHRLILGHLSLRSNATKTPQEVEKEKRDKEALREARAQYEKRKKAEKSMWEDKKWDFS